MFIRRGTSFKAAFSNTCCHGNTFSVFFAMATLFMLVGFKTFWRGLLMVVMVRLFAVSWTYEYFCGFFAFQTTAWIGADQLFDNT